MARLFADVAKFCKNRELADDKMSALLGIYCYTHLYNKSLDTVSYKEVYNFFKELIILHSILVRRSEHFYRNQSCRLYRHFYYSNTKLDVGNKISLQDYEFIKRMLSLCFHQSINSITRSKIILLDCSRSCKVIFDRRRKTYTRTFFK